MTTTKTHATETDRFDIYDPTGTRRIYKNLRDSGNMYDWPGSNGFVSKTDIKRDGLIVVPAAG